MLKDTIHVQGAAALEVIRNAPRPQIYAEFDGVRAWVEASPADLADTVESELDSDFDMWYSESTSGLTFLYFKRPDRV